MVRLKGKAVLAAITVLYGFNSKMVRLKADSEWSPTVLWKFQFQNGAIKSYLGVSNYPCYKKFQFQNGAIKRNHFYRSRASYG